jgi:hypothetical protein
MFPLSNLWISLKSNKQTNPKSKKKTLLRTREDESFGVVIHIHAWKHQKEIPM